MTNSALPTLGILISGRGSNMLAITEACSSGRLRANVGLVISNRADAKGLQSATELGLNTCVVDHRLYHNRDSFDAAIHEQLLEASVDWVILAGFMRILGSEFIDHWPNRVLNIHPSLLPKYPGLNTHQRAIDAGDSEAGASVHIVTAELDAGPVVAQAKVALRPDDNAESLAQRVLGVEHDLYITAIQKCLGDS